MLGTMKIISILLKIPVLKRLLPSIIRRILILFKKEIFEIKFKNLILDTNIKDPHDREIFFTQRYEDRQFKEIFKIIDVNNIEIFFDIGANSGIYSLLLALRFNAINIQAFEPIETTYNKFLKNIKKNKLEKRINAYNFGLSNKNQILKMRTNIKFGYEQSAGYFVSDEGTREAVFKKADDIILYKNKNIFLKIDTEGHEASVLVGMNNLIKNNNVFIQIEIWESNYEKVINILNGYDLKFYKKINNDYYFIKL